MAMLPFAVMAVSSLISYQRAKAESLGLDAKGGLMERAERIVLLCLGLLFDVLLVPILWVMLVLTCDHRGAAVREGVDARRRSRPVTLARIDLRRSRRQSRRVARARPAPPHPSPAPATVADPSDGRARRRAVEPLSDAVTVGGYRLARSRRGRCPASPHAALATADRLRGQHHQPRRPGDDRAPPAARRPDARGAGAAPRRAGGVRLVRPVLDRELPPAAPATSRSSRRASRCRLRARRRRARQGQRRDPRPAAPRWVGVGRSVARRSGAQDHGRRRAARSARAVRLVRRPAQRARHDGGARSGPMPARRCSARCAQRHRVPAVRPRHPRSGVEVEFFGERTTLPAGPATLGMRTGAPILPTAVYFTPRYNGHFGWCARRSTRHGPDRCATTSPGSPSSSPTSSSC